ncbi:MAG: response regulator transcription factor [Sphingobacteriaceae bacterium]|nr:response regulator transcription factor [Sphingobacteriaceae bacterium]
MEAFENDHVQVLMAEDDENLGLILSERLKSKGFEVDLATDGAIAMAMYQKKKYDLLILDIMMPVKDGFTVAKDIRKTDPSTPIIFVTARSMKEDVLKGFEIGADDYLTKPFSMDELMVRIHAVLRRTFRKNTQSNNEAEQFQFSNTLFNAITQSLTINGISTDLTSKESELLRMLCSRINEVVPRDEALNNIWGNDSYFNGRSMDVFISKLRKMLSADERVEIMNVHGKGFKLVVKEG